MILQSMPSKFYGSENHLNNGGVFIFGQLSKNIKELN
jgi:hypothetical protein